MNTKVPEILDFPNYSPAEAARLLGLSSRRISNWIRGEDREPIVGAHEFDGRRYASFLDLIDLLFVREFLKHGFTIRFLRGALGEAREYLGSPHFARSAFFVYPGRLHVQLPGESENILELLSGGQCVLSGIVKPLAKRIEFSDEHGFAVRWFPLGQEVPIVIDPDFAFGAPALLDRGIPTANILDMYQAEDRRPEPVCEWFEITTEEVNAAVLFHERLAAA